MAMLCTQCRKEWEGLLECPQCAIPLQIPALEGVADDQSENAWHRYVLVKILVGIGLAQGLAYALNNLLLAAGSWAIETNPTGNEWDLTQPTQVVYALSAVFGAFIASVANLRARLIGAAVGLINGFLLTSFDSEIVTTLSDSVTWLRPVSQVVWGVFGGMLGMSVFLPAPVLPSHMKPKTQAPKVQLPTGGFFTGQIHWYRILLGVALAVGGVVFAPTIYTFILEKGRGSVTITSHSQANFMVWEIGLLSAFLAGTWAGATTTNGFKQGLFVALPVWCMLIGYSTFQPEFELEAAMISTGQAALAVLFGGWFGGHLFPPLLRHRRRAYFD